MVEFGFPSETKIYINDNLSPYFKGIHYKCRLLKRCRLISNVVVNDGKIKIKPMANSAYTHIEHESMIYELFLNFED